ncbi:hypothetical protein HGA64_01735 [Candidatus Falkowbacteria bacterium]|nr:hypothetical protein [Candidatus Falkowbacteria bacterium]
MRTPIFANFLLAKKAVTAAVIICQAVFLLFPQGEILAAYNSDFGISAPSVSVTADTVRMTVQSTSMTSAVYFEISKQPEVFSVFIARPGIPNMQYFYGAEIPLSEFTAGTYFVRARTVVSNAEVFSNLSSFQIDSTVSPGSITNTSTTTVPTTTVPTENITTPSLSLSWLSPTANTQVAGVVNLKVSTNIPSTVVKFKYFDSSNIGHDIATAMSNSGNVAEMSWDTTSVSDGVYGLKAIAVNPLNISNENSAIIGRVVVKNAVAEAVASTETTAPMPVQGTILEHPSSTLSSQVDFYLRVNQPIESASFIFKKLDQTYQVAAQKIDNPSYVIYKATFNPAGMQPGDYSVVGSMKTTGGQLVNTNYTYIRVLSAIATNHSTSSVASTSISQNATSSSILSVKSWINGLAGGVAGVKLELVAKTTGETKNVIFRLYKSSTLLASYNGTYDQTQGLWLYGVDATSLQDGNYLMASEAYNLSGGKFLGNSIAFTVNKSINETKIVASTTNIQVAKPVVATPATTSVALIPEKITPTATAAAKPSELISTVTEINISKVDEKPVLAKNETINNQVKTTANVAVAPSTNNVLKTQGEGSVPQSCAQLGIVKPLQCELYKMEQNAKSACGKAAATSKEECMNIFLAHFGRPEVCQHLSEEKCIEIVNTVILGSFVPAKTVNSANKEIENMIGKDFSVMNDNDGKTMSVNSNNVVVETLQSEKTQDIWPILPIVLSKEKTNFSVLPTDRVAASRENMVAAVLVIDSDSDGLSDDLEKRLGTDKNDPDSDKDGYSDGEEVKSGHNPLGTGLLAGQLQPIDRVILEKKNVDQPKFSGKTDLTGLKVEKVTKNFSSASSSVMVLEGKAKPNTLVTVYLYSPLPIVLTVQSDKNGNWRYDFDKQLTSGKHEAYVVLNDQDGKVESKSAPFSFFVNEARAISQDDLLQANVNVYDQPNNMIIWYAVAGSFLTLLIAGLAFLYLRSKKNISLN